MSVKNNDAVYEDLKKRVDNYVESCETLRAKLNQASEDMNSEFSFKMKFQSVQPVLQNIMGLASCLFSDIKIFYPEVNERYEKIFAERLTYFINDAQVDVFTTLRVREDRDVFIRQSTEELSRYYKLVKMTTNCMSICENFINTCNQLMFSFSVQKDYEKFISGV